MFYGDSETGQTSRFHFFKRAMNIEQYINVRSTTQQYI